MHLTARHGYDGTKLAMVRKATGLSASSIYWHFANKDQLIEASLEHAFCMQSQSLPNWLESPPGESRRADLHSNILQLPRLDHSMDYWRFGLQLAVVRPPVASPARARFLQIRSESTDWLARWWERTLPAQMEQRKAAALLLGRCTLAIRDSEFIQRHGARQLDDGRVTWMISACLDIMADLMVELAPDRRLDAAAEPSPAAGTAGAQAHGAQAHGAEAHGPEGGREAFLRAAEETIAEFGYDGVTVARVCEKAALPASSLYWSFKDKDDLIATVVDNARRGWETARPDLQPRPADGDWSVILRAFFLRALEGHATQTRIRRLGLLLMLQPAVGPSAGSQQLEPVLQNMQSMTGDWFRTVLSPELDDDARAELAEYLSECVFRILDGLMLSRQADGSSWDPALLAELTSTALYRVALTQGNTVPEGP